MSVKLSDLPYEQLLPVYKLCSVADLICLACTCKFAYHSVKEQLWQTIEISWRILAQCSFQCKHLENLRYTKVLRFRKCGIKNFPITEHWLNDNWDYLQVNYRYLLEHCDVVKLTTLLVDGVFSENAIITTCSLLYNLQEISLNNCDRISDDACQHISRLPCLKRLSFDYCTLYESSVKHIIEVGNLEELRFGRKCGLTQDTLKPLNCLTKLKKLTICDGNFHINQKYLENNLHLNEIVVEYMQINDDILVCISTLVFLKKLVIISSAEVTDVGLSLLSKLVSLEKLNIMFNNFRDATFFHLTKFVSLKELDLSGSADLSDIGLSYIYTMKLLTHLNLQGCKGVSDSALSGIGKLENLKLLNISCCDRVSDLGIQHISKLKRLEALFLDDCNKITSNALSYISQLKFLKHLNLHRCRYVNDIGVDYLTDLVDLEKLTISVGPDIHDIGLLCLKALPLTCLDIERSEQITDEGLSTISCLTLLCELNVGNCSKISDLGLYHLSKLKLLRKLKIAATTITDLGISYLCEGLKLLHEIDIGYCSIVTNIGVSALCSLPSMKQIWLRDCINVDLDELPDFPAISFHKKDYYWTDSKLNYLLDFLSSFESL